MKHLNIYKNESFNMKPLATYITEYIIKKKLDKPIDSEYQYHPNSKEELIKNIQELINNKIYDFNCIDTSLISDMSKLFYNKIFNNINNINFDVSGWDVSNVTNMSEMFNSCYNFDCDLSSWDVSNVENMEGMFNNCHNFTGKGLENWDVSKVEISSFMFIGCEKFDCDLSKWDIRNIRRMSSMFSYCKKFDGKSIENWDVSNVVSARNMFYKCENLDCDLSNWDVSKVKDKGMMFYGCKSLKNKPSWYKE